jgi:hypothetical protein
MRILTPVAAIVGIFAILVLGVLRVAQDLVISPDPEFDHSDDQTALDEGSDADPAPPASAARRIEGR